MEIVVPLNHLAVLVAALSSLVVGSLWYGPIFGKQWVALMKFTPEAMAEAKKKGMGKTYAMQLVASLVMAYVMAHSLVFAAAYLKTSGVAAGFQVGFWNWLGFILPVSIGSGLWDGKPWKLVWINAFHYLATLCAMGVILALWN